MAASNLQQKLAYHEVHIFKQKIFDTSEEILINSLPAMDAHERPLFIELRGTVVSRRIFIRSQSLIAR
jgi:hypothetical protein